MKKEIKSIDIERVYKLLLQLNENLKGIELKDVAKNLKCSNIDLLEYVNNSNEWEFYTYRGFKTGKTYSCIRPLKIFSNPI